MPYTVLHGRDGSVWATEAETARGAYQIALKFVTAKLPAVRIVGPGGAVSPFEDFERRMWDGSLEDGEESPPASVTRRA